VVQVKLFPSDRAPVYCELVRLIRVLLSSGIRFTMDSTVFPVMAGRRLANASNFFLLVITVNICFLGCYVFLDAITPLTHRRKRPHRVGAPEVQKPKVFPS
jgi:hypothetical protein